MERRYFEIQHLQTRNDSDSDDLYLEGAFVVYNSNYQVWDGATESVAPGAFRNSIHGDVRALYNHNDDLVLGRTSAGTFTLEDREDGLWGKIKVNRNDTDAMNAYERVKRGDVSGCSFGFEIKSETTEHLADGSTHWTITEVDPLYECSLCVFPAYEATHISARGRDFDNMQKRKKEVWKYNMLRKLKGADYGFESTDASEED